jgi:hypothetical protein
MKIKRQIITTTFFIIYLIIVLLTDISLTGFWTDVIFSILLSIFSLTIVFRNKNDKARLTWILRISNITCSLIVFGLLGLNFINPFGLDTFKLRSFYYQSVEGRLFNAYFKPVGAYSGGYGNFWVTEIPTFFSIIEWRVYSERTVHHDFRNDTYEGEAIDNYEVVRDYIKDEVINRK